MKKFLMFFPFYRKWIEKKEEAALQKKQEEEIRIAQRAWRGKICYAKLMERLAGAKHIRDARIKKYKKALRRGWQPKRRHLGLLIDRSAFAPGEVIPTDDPGAMPEFHFIPAQPTTFFPKIQKACEGEK